MTVLIFTISRKTECALSTCAAGARFQAPFEIAGHTPHEIVRFPQSVQSDVDMKLEIRIARQGMLRDFVNPMRLQTVCRQD